MTDRRSFHRQKTMAYAGVTAAFCMLVGCGGPAQNAMRTTPGSNVASANHAAAAAGAVPGLGYRPVHVIKSDYLPNTEKAILYVRSTGRSQPNARSGSESAILDANSSLAAVNYATSVFSNRIVRHVQIVEAGAKGVLWRSDVWNVPSESIGIAASPGQTPPSTTQGAGTNSPLAGFAAGSRNLPPGVGYDSGVRPLAPPSASSQQKFQAVLRVAKSKLGTKYIWGHNEDRGQYGFDCSNFTSYVYHHALGYSMSDLSKAQYLHVGYKVPVSQMQPGDLICFEQGAHVGIYIGGRRMIQCGGGLNQVGYLSLDAGSYWGHHISAVKRMF